MDGVALGVAFPDATWQQRPQGPIRDRSGPSGIVHFCRNVFTAVPKGKMRR